MADDKATTQKKNPPAKGAAREAVPEPVPEPAQAVEAAPPATLSSAAFFAGAGVIRHATLWEARAAAMVEADYVQKRKAEGLNYTYAGEAAIVGKLHEAFARHGLFITPMKVETKTREVYSTTKGAQMNRVVVETTYRIRHAFSGEHEDMQAVGEGCDSGDKALAKAQTMAFKYLLRQMNMLETGNDPDDTPSAEQERAAPQQRQAGPTPRRSGPGPADRNGQAAPPAKQPPTEQQLYERAMQLIPAAADRPALDSLHAKAMAISWTGDRKQQVIAALNKRLHEIEPPAPVEAAPESPGEDEEEDIQF